MNTFKFFGLAIIIIFLLSACGTPLQEYQPKTEKEKGIKSLLVEFAKARNDYNVNRMASCLTDDCKIEFFTRSLTKAKFASAFKREDLERTGKLKFVDPEIKIIGAIAEASVKAKQGLSVWTFKFKMIHKSDGWKIIELSAS